MASMGWLNPWKICYRMRQLTVSGESKLSNWQAVEKFRLKLHEPIKKEGYSG